MDANFTILVEPKPNLPTRNISSTSTNSTNKTEEVYIETEPAQQESKLKEVLQSKNADKSKPKSQKREFNYASFDCGALILSSNKDAKHSTAILSNSKDSYLLNKCSSEKFVEVELCQDILVHQIALANFEYFSSMFKEFKIYGSSKLPPSWTLLGTYQGRNVRNRQYFDIQDPVLWTKYIRIEFVSHYGNEFYCPLTSLQVFGTTMIEDFKQFDDIDDEQQILYKATEVKNEVILPISQDSNSQSLNQDPKAPSLSSPNPTCLHPFFDPWKEIHSNIESISNNPTSSPFPKHSSIFTKIVNRLTMLEKTHISMENQQNRLQSMLKQHRIEKNVDLRELEVKLSRAIQEKGNDVNRGLLQLRKQRQELDEKLNFYTKMVDTLNYQLGWSLFWNQVLFAFCIFLLKVMNDRFSIMSIFVANRTPISNPVNIVQHSKVKEVKEVKEKLDSSDLKVSIPQTKELSDSKPPIADTELLDNSNYIPRYTSPILGSPNPKIMKRNSNPS
ncbi:hypothetical protein HDV02_002667 [Globomyces sp. JEL0801]|nr:hypothetical protein HDV02_002667 [Globomyces sp. JEL0801]